MHIYLELQLPIEASGARGSNSKPILHNIHSIRRGFGLSRDYGTRTPMMH